MGSSGELTGCCSFTKYVFMFFNILFFLTGAAAFGIGVWANVSESFTEKLKELLVRANVSQAEVDEIVQFETIQAASIVVIVGGAVVMVIGFLGCLGAWRENQCMLTTFFVSLFIVLGLIIAGAVLIYQFPDFVKKSSEKFLQTQVDQWTSGNITAIDELQKELKCCGVKGPGDYNGTVPDSCKNTTATPVTNYKTGCSDAIVEKVREVVDANRWIAVGILFAVLAVILCGMVLSCSLCCAIRKQSDEYV